MKIFINAASGLGNIILFIPAYRYLIKKYPNAEITISFDNRSYTDRFIRTIFNSATNFELLPTGKFKILKILQFIFRMRREKFDLSISVYTLPSWRIALFLALIGAKRTGYIRSGKFFDKFINKPIELDFNDHYLIRNLKTVGVKENFNKFISSSWVNLYNRERSYFIKRIGIHAGGNLGYNSARQWPIDYFKGLVQLLLDKYDVEIFLFGKGFDEERINNTIKNGNKNISIVSSKDLFELGSQLASCDYFVGNDSGVMNFAVSIGIPTISILGPTNPKHTGAYGIYNKISRLEIECSPCFEKGLSEKCTHHSCLITLYPSIVFQQIQEHFDKIKVFSNLVR